MQKYLHRTVYDKLKQNQWDPFWAASLPWNIVLCRKCTHVSNWTEVDDDAILPNLPCCANSPEEETISQSMSSSSQATYYGRHKHTRIHTISNQQSEKMYHMQRLKCCKMWAIAHFYLKFLSSHVMPNVRSPPMRACVGNGREMPISGRHMYTLNYCLLSAFTQKCWTNS